MIHQQSLTWLIRYFSLLIIFVIGYNLITANAYGSPLGARFLQVSSSVVSDTNVTYNLGFNIVTQSNLGSILIQFCGNSALFQDPCNPPTGFDDSNAVLSNQTGETGFSILTPTSPNQIILTRNSIADTPQPVSYTFTNIVNPSSDGGFFVRLQTFASSDASGSSVDYGGIATTTTPNLSIAAEVPPYLYFCSAIVITGLNCSTATGSYVNFGTLSSSNTSYGSSDLLVGTNGKNGYSITVAGDGLVSGNNVINSIAADDVSRPGTNQFGINLVANQSPNIGADPIGPGNGLPTANYDNSNFFMYQNGDIIASYNQPDNYRQYTVSYIVNVSSTQPPGVYVSTINYICTGNF